MHFFNKTILVNNFNSLYRALKNIKQTPMTTCFCENKIAMKHSTKEVVVNGNIDKRNMIRIWSTKTFLNWWYHSDFASEKFIAALDYTIEPKSIRIDYMNINDKNCAIRSNYKLDDKTSLRLNENLLDFLMDLAKKEKKEKIIVDVHNNLRIFNTYYEPKGFVITNRKCADNPYWLEAELNV